MKTLIKISLSVALMLASLPTQAMGFLFKPQSQVQYVPYTNYQTIVITNSAGVAVATNTLQQVGMAPSTNTTFAVNPQVQEGLKLVSTYAPIIPAPFGDILGLVGAGATALLGLGLRAKNGQLATTSQKLGTAQSIVTAVIQGVEAAGDSTTKASIQSHATAAGVQEDLHYQVQGMTAGPVGQLFNRPAATPATKA